MIGRNLSILIFKFYLLSITLGSNFSILLLKILISCLIFLSSSGEIAYLAEDDKDSLARINEIIAHVSAENALRADWIANSLLDEIVHDLIVVELDSQKEESVRLLLEKEKENLRLLSEKKDEEIGLLVDRIRAPRKVVKLLFLIYLTCILPMFW